MKRTMILLLLLWPAVLSAQLPPPNHRLIVSNSPDFSAPTTTWYINVQTTATSYAPGMTLAPGTTYYAKVKSILDPSSTTAAAWSPTISFNTGCVSPPSP